MNTCFVRVSACRVLGKHPLEKLKNFCNGIAKLIPLTSACWQDTETKKLRLISYQPRRYFHQTPSFLCHKNTPVDLNKVLEDPQLKEILKDLRDDFDDEKTADHTSKKTDSHSETKDSAKISGQSDKNLNAVNRLERDTTYHMNTDVEEEQYDSDSFDEIQTEEKWESPVELKRGERGVFDLAEMMTVLESENARDICTLRLPPEIQFADQMVVVSALSYRHMMAIAKKIRWIYKQKKGKKDPPLKIEGFDTRDWLAMDLGNLILHIFLPDTREYYDLESLWTLGPEFDERCKEEEDPYVFEISSLPWLQGKTENTEQDKDSEDSMDDKKS